MNYTAHYGSPLGAITLASDGKKLTGLWFDGQKHFASTLHSDHEERPQLSIFEQTFRWLDIYFSGQQPTFTPPLLLRTTPFRQEVAEIVRSIPFGQTLTYGQIAQLLARRQGRHSLSAQAIGGAVGHNTILLIIPCHRVMGANDSLTGYAGGLERKRCLLQMEGALPYLDPKTAL